MKDVTSLTDGWLLHLQDGGTVPATVPGCVHTDLMAAGLLEDPCLGVNEPDSAWIGRADWTYTNATGLTAPESGHERTDLVFDGLDTVARIQLGDTLLGRTRNMHRPHRFDVTGLLGPAAGPLTVTFTSAYTEAEQVRARVGDRPSAYPEPINYVRKTACNFGWDWGPTLVTAGIWKQARLEHWSTARLRRVRPLVTVEEGTGRVEVRADLERSAQGGTAPLTVSVSVAGRHAEDAVAAGADEAAVVLRVPYPDLWWPRGHGEQPLYGCEVTLTDARDGTVLDRFETRIGFRSVRLGTAPDADGSAFTFVVNGRPLFVRGVNWIPDDVFPTRVTPERHRARLGQAADAGVNLVRVWGGGLYEVDAFYDACDELGLLVWQDFLFACAAYPEEAPLRGEVEAEARENVARLTPHPGLVLWNGNNENLWGFRDWGWEEPLGGRSWGEGYYLGLLPRVVAETDPTRPYWPGSPWSGSWRHHPNDPAHGATHSWEVWNQADYTDYLLDVPRFVAEFGWQAPPTHATLRRALGDDQLAADSPGMLHHQKAEDGQGKLRRGLERHFTAPRTFDAWHYLTQVNQARAIATGVEHWRSHWPRCSGTVLWQLNDTWPGTSWSAIDGDGRLKPLYHELRRLYADRLLTVGRREGDGGGLSVAAVNHGRSAWAGEVRLRRVEVTGRVSASAVLPFDAGADSVAAFPVPAELVPDAGCRDELLVADAGNLRAVWFPVRDKDFRYPAPEWEVSLADGADSSSAEVRVTARTLLRDLLLQADRLDPDAVADRGLLTLLPGEQATITVRGWHEPDAAAVEQALFTVAHAQGTAP